MITAALTPHGSYAFPWLEESHTRVISELLDVNLRMQFEMARWRWLLCPRYHASRTLLFMSSADDGTLLREPYNSKSSLSHRGTVSRPFAINRLVPQWARGEKLRDFVSYFCAMSSLCALSECTYASRKNLNENLHLVLEAVNRRIKLVARYICRINSTDEWYIVGLRPDRAHITILKGPFRRVEH